MQHITGNRVLIKTNTGVRTVTTVENAIQNWGWRVIKDDAT
jgi:hypothetical protein